MMLVQKLPRLFFKKLCLIPHNNTENFFTTAQVYASQIQGTRLPHGYNAPSPFALYVKENIKVGTGERAPDAMKRVSATWKGLSIDEKNVFYQNSKKIKEEKRAEFERLPEKNKHDLLLKNVERLEKRKRVSRIRELHEFRTATNKPKQPMGSYMLFVKDLYDQVGSQKAKTKEDVAKFGASAGEKWRGMSSQQKKPYEEKAAVLKEQYQKDLSEWKTQHADEIAEWEKKHKPKQLRTTAVRKTAKKAAVGASKLKSHKASPARKKMVATKKKSSTK